MRVLQFHVEGLTLAPDPNCDFSNIAAGTSGYLQAQFTFSEDWRGFQKVVAFSSGNHEYPPQVLDSRNSCEIPPEALERPIFRVQVLGKHGTDKLITNRILVYQKGGNE